MSTSATVKNSAGNNINFQTDSIAQHTTNDILANVSHHSYSNYQNLVDRSSNVTSTIISDSNCSTVPVRDATSLKTIKYGPGHEKYPSWPVAAIAEQPQILRRVPPSGGSHRSKSWTDHTNYPKENDVMTYTRPYMKTRPNSQQKLRTVLERCEKLSTEGRFESSIRDNSIDNMTATINCNDMDNVYLPRLDREGKVLGDLDYMVPSPPERDISTTSNKQKEFEAFTRSTYHNTIPQHLHHQVHHVQLTQADLEEYTRSYEAESLIGTHQHTKQSSYAQSEGYHSYVSSTDSMSTPFLDRLRRDSEATSVRITNSSTNNSNNSSSWNNDEQPERDNRSGRGRDSVVTTSSGSGASSSETLKWHGSMSDVSSVASSSCVNNNNNSNNNNNTSSRQLIAHSARVETPQRHHHSESVLLINPPLNDQQQCSNESINNTWKEREIRNNHQNKLRLFPVNTYTVQPDEVTPSHINHYRLNTNAQQQTQSNSNTLQLSPTTPVAPLSVADRVSELERTCNQSSTVRYTYLDPEKRHRVSDPTLKAIQKKALLSFYERHHVNTSNSINKPTNTTWRSEPQLAKPINTVPITLSQQKSQTSHSPPPQPPPRPKTSQTSRRASSASDYAKETRAGNWREARKRNQDESKLSPRHQHSNSCGSLSNDLLGPVIMGPSISIDDWVPERPPKNPHLRTAFPDLFPPDDYNRNRIPSPEDLPPPSPPTVYETEVINNDDPLPPPPSETELWPEYDQQKHLSQQKKSSLNPSNKTTSKTQLSEEENKQIITSRNSDLLSTPRNVYKTPEDKNELKTYSSMQGSHTGCQNYRNIELRLSQASMYTENPQITLTNSDDLRSPTRSNCSYNSSTKSPDNSELIIRRTSFPEPQAPRRNNMELRLSQTSNRINHQKTTPPTTPNSDDDIATKRTSFVRSTSYEKDAAVGFATHRQIPTERSSIRHRNGQKMPINHRMLEKNQNTVQSGQYRAEPIRSVLNHRQYQKPSPQVPPSSNSSAVKTGDNFDNNFRNRALSVSDKNSNHTNGSLSNAPPLQPRQSKAYQSMRQSRPYHQKGQHFDEFIRPTSNKLSVSPMIQSNGHDDKTLAAAMSQSKASYLSYRRDRDRSQTDADYGSYKRIISPGALNNNISLECTTVDCDRSSSGSSSDDKWSSSKTTTNIHHRLHSKDSSKKESNESLLVLSHNNNNLINRLSSDGRKEMKTRQNNEIKNPPELELPTQRNLPDVLPVSAKISPPRTFNSQSQDEFSVLDPSKSPLHQNSSSEISANKETSIIFSVDKRSSISPTPSLVQIKCDRPTPPSPSKSQALPSCSPEINSSSIIKDEQTDVKYSSSSTQSVIIPEKNLVSLSPPTSTSTPEIMKIPTSANTVQQQQPQVVEGLQLIQRTEVILRVNTCTTDAASQTEQPRDLEPLASFETAVSSQYLPRTPLSSTRLGKSQEEIDCEQLSRDLASQLSPSDKLKGILVPAPEHKKSTDYVSGLFKLDITSRPRPNSGSFTHNISAINRLNTMNSSTNCDDTSISNRSSIIQTTFSSNSSMNSSAFIESSSPLSATSTYFTTSEPKAKFLTRYSRDMTQLNGCVQDTKDLNQKKEELMSRLDRKLEVLRSEQLVVNEERRINDALGEQVSNYVTRLAQPQEVAKFRLHIEEVGKITSLLLGLSGRLARAENALMGLTNDHVERKILENKRDKLKEQLEEAKKLKENIDRRSINVSQILYKYLNSEEYGDYDHFINMKAKLIMDGRELSDKIKLGEEQLTALRETMTIPTNNDTLTSTIAVVNGSTVNDE